VIPTHFSLPTACCLTLTHLDASKDTAEKMPQLPKGPVLLCPLKRSKPRRLRNSALTREKKDRRAASSASVSCSVALASGDEPSRCTQSECVKTQEREREGKRQRWIDEMRPCVYMAWSQCHTSRHTHAPRTSDGGASSLSAADLFTRVSEREYVRVYVCLTYSNTTRHVTSRHVPANTVARRGGTGRRTCSHQRERFALTPVSRGLDDDSVSNQPRYWGSYLY
jgi:hypothetical protein